MEHVVVVIARAIHPMLLLIFGKSCSAMMIGLDHMSRGFRVVGCDGQEKM
jgi:hypothetical protein